MTEGLKNKSSLKTSFDTFRIGEGQLSLVRPFPLGYPPSFQTELKTAFSTTFPTDMPGEDLMPPLASLDTRPGRLVRKIEVGDVTVVVKGFGHTAAETLHDPWGRKRHLNWGGSALLQFRKVEAVKERYKQEYGEELNIEEELGFFIGKKPGQDYQRFVIYRYYPQAESPTNEQSQELWNNEAAKIREQAKRIERLRGIQAVDIFNPDASPEGVQFVMTGDPIHGYKGILIDTEHWELRF